MPSAVKTYFNHKLLGKFLKLLLYVMLIALGFVYLYPLLHIIVTSVKSLPDLLDPSVNWIPTQLSLDNYKQAFEVMHVAATWLDTVLVSLLPAIAQTAACALAGYGFARYAFPGRKILLALVLLTFIIPAYVLMAPTYAMYSDYKILGTLQAAIFPALAGQGVKSAIFILIFMQFFSQTPISLDEAARVDGAGEARIFFRIGLPMAVPAMVVTFLFSFVWYWNETYFTAMYLGSHGSSGGISTMLLELEHFEQSYKGYLQSLSGWGAGFAGDSVANEAIKMAATVIAMLPLLGLYLVLQRQFVESIDRVGITGE
ncbi:MAG: carbohydrate ABC transporter permease [Clostridiales bacterium]|jgi:multiple sugar transport system permease protein|nr:carbohydrate ABC transporter permease [Clostridiales bacterium]